MNESLIHGLVFNAALLLSVSIIYNVFFLKYDKDCLWKKVLTGFALGVLGILLMQNTVILKSGIIFDTRSILVSVAALFFGAVPSLISAAIIIIYRVIIGGDGALMGVSVTIVSAVIGLLWNTLRLNLILNKKSNAYVEFYMFGIIVHVGMLLCTIALPYNSSLYVLKQIALPVMIIYPAGTFLLCMILYNCIKNSLDSIEIEKGRALLITLMDSIPDLIFSKDCNGVYVGCNTAFEKFAGKNQNEIIGRTDFELFNTEMAELFRKMDSDMLKQGKPRKNEEVVTYPDGSKVFLETVKTPYFDSNGKLLGLIGISRDITERKKREDEILYLTYHDVLTGLYNRNFMDQEKKRLDTKRQLPLSIIIGDINGLKLINDAFGHDEGDKMLFEIAKILKQCSREEDIVARIGGDEFCILLPKTKVHDASSIIKRINKACEDYNNSKNKESYFASISLGYATKNDFTQPLEKVVKEAEEFMYRRKLFEHKSIHSSILSSIKSTMFEKSNETEEHAERMAELSKKLGTAMGLTEDKIDELELLSTLHDIGKISINESILTKNGPLTENEWDEIKKHPEVGYRITQASPELMHISEYILSHHERWDGNGYPQGLSAKNIPLLSRIIAVVDSYDAMTSDRIYRKAMSKEYAIAELEKNAGSQFDPFITRIFIDEVLHK